MPLARPLSVFGASFEVLLSSACTLNPVTTLQAVTGISLLNFLRNENPVHLQNLKTLVYAGRGKHRPSETTRKRILQDLKLLDSEAVSAVLNGKEPPQTFAHSDWRLVLQGMGAGQSNFVHDIATSLALWDDEALRIRELAHAGKMDQAHACTEALIGKGLLAWEALNPRVLQVPEVLILVESSMQALARLVCAINSPLLDLPSRELAITQLLDPKRRPIGHWLHDVQQAADCTSLSDLTQRLLSVGARHLGRTISYDLLKKWSSSKNVVMPQTAVQPMLLSVRIRERGERLRDRFYVARFLTFLCDLTCAGIPGENPDWAEIQEQLRERYSQVHQLTAANWQVPSPTA